MQNVTSVARTEFAAAISQIATERKIPVESIYEAIRQALVSAYRKQLGLFYRSNRVDADGFFWDSTTAILASI